MFRTLKTCLVFSLFSMGFSLVASTAHGLAIIDDRTETQTVTVDGVVQPGACGVEGNVEACRYAATIEGIYAQSMVGFNIFDPTTGAFSDFF